MHKYKLIDLFAGAGGLSLGFQKTGRFEIKAFVEKNANAAETYQHNFINADRYGDVKDLDFRELNEKYKGIDIVIGGPPCQGFSNANRQHNQAINQNNKLVKQYIRAVLEMHPKAFVMENVGMLKSNVHRFYIERSDEGVIEKYKIHTKQDAIFLLDKNYVFDGAERLVSNIEDIEKNKWNSKLYSLLNIWLKDSKSSRKMDKAIQRHDAMVNKLINEHMPANESVIRDADGRLFHFILNSKDLNAEKDQLTQLLKKPIAFQKMLQHAQEIHDNGISAEFSTKDAEGNLNNLTAKVKSCAVFDYLTGILESGKNGYAINKGILSAEEFGIPQKRRRFVLIGVEKHYAEAVELPVPSKNISKTTVHDAIHDLADDQPYESVNNDMGIYVEPLLNRSDIKLGFLRDSDEPVFNHIIPKTTKEALKRFEYIKQGQNFHDLPDSMKTNTYTNAARTQNTIYKRLKDDEPSGTVVNVRKSMWIHPTKNRAVSVREAARLQSFPDSFRFYGPKDSEYQQVGNAVPPMLAKAIAKQILKYIDNKMSDNHTKEQRHLNMSHIRSNNTKPEEIVRKYLFSRGLRYRKNVKGLPGKPDIVMRKYHAVVFVNGCFWHHHDCGRFHWPSSHQEYWHKKIERNVERDKQEQALLEASGWRVFVIWECELKKKVREKSLEKLYHEITSGFAGGSSNDTTHK